jgi:hypothetical protein
VLPGHQAKHCRPRAGWHHQSCSCQSSTSRTPQPVALRESWSPRLPLRVAGLTWSPGTQIFETRGFWHRVRDYDIITVSSLLRPMRAASFQVRAPVARRVGDERHVPPWCVMPATMRPMPHELSNDSSMSLSSGRLPLREHGSEGGVEPAAAHACPAPSTPEARDLSILPSIILPATGEAR